MIENSIKQFRARRNSNYNRVDTVSASKERRGLAQRQIARSQDETRRALQRAGEAQEAQYNPAERVNSWAGEIEAIREERRASAVVPENMEQSTSRALGVNHQSAARPQAGTRSQVRGGDDLRQGLIDRGLEPHVADGFVMNFRDESGLDAGINERVPLVPGSRGGFGLYQLTGPRRVDYEAFADSRGVPYSDTDAQLDFLMIELEGSESSAASKIFATETSGEAGAAIVNHFLRPSPEYRRKRASRYLSSN